MADTGDRAESDAADRPVPDDPSTSSASSADGPTLTDEQEMADASTDTVDETVTVQSPPLPPGRFVDLTDDPRGDLGRPVVRTAGDDRAGRPVALLHGWTATADLNWFRCYEPVSRDRPMFAFDHRGHGTGIRSKKRFRLEDCADDVVAVADQLGIDRFIACGYSMGGPVAQLLWQRHPDRIAGLILCATAATFSGGRAERWSFLGLTGLAAVARVTPEQARLWLTEQLYLQRKTESWEPWAIEQAASHDWRLLLEAGSAIGEFDSTAWIGEVDVPTALIVTRRDQVISQRRQSQLFRLLEHADVFRIDGMHDACVADADQFVPALRRALDSVDPRA